jgi:multidrug efflux pump subunit AcrB
LQVGVTQKDVSNAVSVSLSSSFQTNPNFWMNNKNGICYNLAAQTPQIRIASIDDFRNTAVTPSKQTLDQLLLDSRSPVNQPQLLTNLASFTRKQTPAVINHLNVLPVYDVYASCQGRDLGGVAQQVSKIVETQRKSLARGNFIFVAGQVMSMYKAFAALIAGLVFAVVLVYLLLVVNFQSWTDPIIILMAIPGALSGIVWSLFVTQTTFSIPALMGTIMTVGVASANSILMITFAREQFSEGHTAKVAALNAGFQRFRPVVMTAAAMIIGMIPMAIGAGQGGSQNAPIGRAVIGGLCVATLSTLIFVPLIFSLTRGRVAAQAAGPGREET